MTEQPPESWPVPPAAPPPADLGGWDGGEGGEGGEGGGEGRYPGRQRDPGSRTAALIALLIAIPVFLGVAAMQQYSAFATPPQTPEAAPQTEIEPPAEDNFLVLSRAFVRLGDLLPAESPLGPSLFEQVEGAAVRDVDQLRLAIVEAELIGPAPAAVRLDALRWRVDPDDPVYDDVALLARLLTDGPEAIEADRLDAWVARHGWFGELALVLDDAAESPARQAITSGGLRFVVFGLAVAGVLLIAIMGGLIGVITLIARCAVGLPERHFQPPAPGGSVYLEMFALFLVGFIGLQIVGAAVAQVASDAAAITFTLAAQWVLLGVVLWPVLRGTPWRQVREDLGLHAPRGAVREGLVGIWMYFAGLPLLVLAILITMAMLFGYDRIRQASGGEPGAPPSNPVLELFGQAGPLQLILAVALAVVWAPLVEEIVFRGALYRHMRSRIGVVLAAPTVAVLFGLMHGYMILMLAPVITLGLIFAIMREWRDSIVPCIVGHALHNGAVVSLMLLGFWALT